MLTENVVSLTLLICIVCYRKFICLNDNMDSTREEDNQLIRAVLIDFFHSLFPKPSQFELPPDYRNRYLYHKEFVSWHDKKRKLSMLLYVILSIVLILMVFCLFQNEVSVVFMYCQYSFITSSQSY